MAAYCRAPSKELRHASSAGPLRALLSLGERKVAGWHLDVHLRRKDEVHVYCGLTRLVVVQRKTNGNVRVTAAKSYADQQCSRGFFGLWPRSRLDGVAFERKLTQYVESVLVDCRWVRLEGSVQSAWSRIAEPWVPFDREAVLEYPSTSERDRSRCFDAVARARERVDALRVSQGWAQLSKRGGEVDQLAVDPDGRLVVIELKHASASGVYYAPLQLLQYVWEWHDAFETTRTSMQELLDARVELRLTPPHVPPIGSRIRPVVGFGIDERSKEVKRRYAKVLALVNEHLPPGADPMETWSLPGVGRVPIRSEGAQGAASSAVTANLTTAGPSIAVAIRPAIDD